MRSLLHLEGVYWVPKLTHTKSYPLHRKTFDRGQDVINLLQVPEDIEEQAKELKKAGIISAVQRGKRERPRVAKKEKKKRAVNFDRYKKITNQHLPELFTGNATSID